MGNAINICGYVRSGRSAVSSWAEGCANAVRFPNNEARFVRHPGGLAWLHRRLLQRQLTSVDAAYFKELVYGQITPAFLSSWHRPEEAAWCNEDGAYALQVLGGGLRRLVEAFVDAISVFDAAYCQAKGVAQAEAQFLDLARGFTTKLASLTLGTRSGAKCLYANVFNAPYASYATYFTGLDILFVDRDPRDLYQDQLAGDVYEKRESFKEFCDEYCKIRNGAWVPAARTGAPHVFELEGNRYIYVFFEDFVTSEDYRRQLANLVGLNLEGWSSAKARGRFKVEQSRQNVGLGVPDLSAVADDHPARRYFFPR